MPVFKNILVPIDFGEPSAHALEVGIDFAKESGAKLTLVHVWEVPAYAYTAVSASAVDLLTPIQEAAESQLATTLAEVRKQVPQAESILRQGSSWREILAMIEEKKPDLVIMGTHGRRGVERAFLGSVAEKIVRTSPAAVLTVRGKNDR